MTAPPAPAKRQAAVLGVALWSPSGAARPRRRTSLLGQMVAEVAAQAAAQAGVSLSRVPVVMGSAFGEMATTVEMLGEREQDGTISPTRFHNSVHNSSAGHLSIAHKNTSFTTSIAAGNETVAMVLLEALTLLADRGGEVLVLVADEPLPTSLGQTTEAVAAALVLAAGHNADGAPRPLAWLGDLRQVVDPSPGALRPVEVANPSAAILPLVAAITSGRGPARLELSAGPAARWSIAFTPPEAAR